MAKFITCHRRGTTKQWLNKGIILREGEIGIEYADEEQSTARLLIGTKNGRNALQFAPISKIRTIPLPANNWSGDTSPFSQVVIVEHITENSRIDLQPTTDILTYLNYEEISLTAYNDSGVVYVYALNYKPTIDIAIQVSITEVVMG